VATGEIFGYLGRNGAGKTTTVRIFTTLIRASSGEARICGLDVQRGRAEVRRRVGLSLQQAALDELMTGSEHLELVAGLAKIPRPRARRRIADLQAAFGLTETADRLVATYSVGIRRRLDAAMALIHEPDVLFLDEPSTGLDPQSRRALWTAVREYRAQGGTVFLTTQYLDEADELCDRIGILHDGKLVVVDTPARLKADYGGKVLHVRGADEAVQAKLELSLGRECVRDGRDLSAIVRPQDMDLPVLLESLAALKVSIDRITLADCTLEDVFVQLTGELVDSRGADTQAVGVAAISRSIASTRGGSRS
jgi:ABC-2 type transport system ATP-binding protein